MIRLTVLAVAVLAVAGLATVCQADKTGAGFGAALTWRLTELAGQPLSGGVTLSFAPADRIAGKAPCNRYAASMTAPYPAFKTGPILSTKMACPNLAEEDAFFTALAAMSQAEVSGDTLILRDDTGTEMRFKASE